MKIFAIFTRMLRALFTPQICLIWGASLWLMLTSNHALFEHLLNLYPWNAHNAGFIISISLFFTFSITLWLMLLSHGKSARWVLAIILLSAAWAAFYMDEFGVIIDHVMLDNAAKTDTQEVMGLLSWGFVIKMLVLGVLPAFIMIKKIPARFFQRDAILTRLKHIALLILGMVLVIIPFTADYATFIREHKMVRMYANPTFFHYSLIKWGSQKLFSRHIVGLQKTALDVRNIEADQHHELIIMVVGETARFDRFSLNGYPRITNPRLAKENVVSFKQVSSCGTSTGVSVPCMFSMLTRKQYDEDKALHMENALDVLNREGVKVLWRDNNSDSKGVALRVPYEDFRSPAHNPVCDDNECRDIGMLSGLDKFIEKNKDHDILIVLHQMGNHGPEYYRRYPDEFKKFTPICKTGRLSECSRQEIDNSYDNAILYTDYFLSEVIQFLKKYDSHRETAMLYVADHGESLGEHGIYLHAAPYMIAPKEQTHVPAILWVGQHFDYQLPQIAPYENYPLSHDDVFCTLLTAYELKSEVCHAEFGWLAQNRELQEEQRKHLHPIKASTH
ncbi:phosphoethanolamine transferase [Methylophilus sp. 14]|uniref:phosphoethanolamine transferase n=1 Tax=Methylophilus sp. 14 TaxID=2781019 RepID=UPI001E5E1D22|nr:phosphoethanolamine--lipid A transferase [Methylophilus sp. 14]